MSKENPKVYFCNSFLESCWYVRALVPMIEAGWDGDRTSLRSPRIDSQRQTAAVLSSDIVIFHRPNDWRSMEIALKLRGQGKKIVADNDDTYKNLEGKNLQKALEHVDAGLDKFCEMADMVTCSTEVLAEEYRKLNKNVVVLPNCIDPDIWPEPLKNETEKVRLGFVGSVASNGDYTEIKELLKDLSNRKNVQLVVFALPPQSPNNNDTEAVVVREMYQSDYEFWRSLNVEWQPFVPVADYIDALNELRLDIIVIPRKDDYFNRCKSNLKFLEASMLEIPVVAAGFSDNLSPYQVNPEDRNYLSLAFDASDFKRSLEVLIENPAMRKNIGQQAKKYVLEKYAIKNNIHLWTQAYQSLLS